MIRFKTSFIAPAALALTMTVGAIALAEAEDDQPNPPEQSWSFHGVFGKYDQAQLQRGFQVYKEVCSTCHRLSIPFRALADPDGPGYSVGQVKTLAASYQVENAEPNDKGEMFQRPGTPADIFPPPAAFPNDAAAVATMGRRRPTWRCSRNRSNTSAGFPTFIFDIFTAYQEMGADYVYAILNGYTKPDDPTWNLYFPGHKIAMPQPLTEGQVKYDDGTPGTLQNYSRDIGSFLTWAAEPTLVERKKTGFRVVIFLIVLSTLLYFTKKKIWADAH